MIISVLLFHLSYDSVYFKFCMKISGFIQMKQTARIYCWWPSINRDIEEALKQFAICKKCFLRNVMKVGLKLEKL